MCASVINLADWRVARADPVLSQVESYWDGLRGGRLAPSRAEVNPSGLTGVLRNCFILEKIAPSMAQFRVGGLTVSEILGNEAPGVPFSRLFRSDAQERLESALERVFTSPVMAEFRLRRPASFRAREGTGLLLLLPLSDDLGKMTRILGCISLDTAAGMPPSRFEIDGVCEREITRTRPASFRPSAVNARLRGPADIVSLPSAAS